MRAKESLLNRNRSAHLPGLIFLDNVRAAPHPDKVLKTDKFPDFMLLRSLIAIVAVAAVPVIGSAQTSTNQSPEESRSTFFESFKAGGLAQTARDFRAGSEALERFGRSLESACNRLADAMEKVSEHHAEASREFDPFGFKTAFLTIQKQNEIMYRLQQREIRQVRKGLLRGEAGAKKRVRHGKRAAPKAAKALPRKKISGSSK